MKLTSLAVITLLVFGCSGAFAQGSGTLGFTSAGGLFLYCNYETFQYGGSNNFYFQGVDNLQSACFATNNGTIEGVKVNITAAAGAPVSQGPAYAYADNIIDAESGIYTGEQWFVITQLKPSKLLHKFGWAGYIGFDGYEFLGNYGYLSAEIPGAQATKQVLKTSSAGAAKQSQTRAKTISK
ncbi:MAG: hypothetical protein ACLPHI_19330 [Terriglobales bacterium]